MFNHFICTLTWYVADEPGLSARGGYPNGLPEDIEAKYAEFLLDNVSVIALDGDFVCGVMVSCIEKRSKMVPTKPTFDQLKSEMNEKHALINLVCNDTIHCTDFFKQYPDIDQYLDLFAVGVHKNYRRMGIASALVEKSLEAGKSNHCKAAIIIATNPHTNGIAKKFEFKPYKSVKWSDYKDNNTGEQWFPDEKMPHSIVNSYFKLFQ